MQRSTDRKRTAHEYIEGRLARHEYDEVADILAGAQLALDWAPSRSTFYAWVREWRKAQARDTSGWWSLATDETGRPDLVLDVMAALIGRAGGRGVRVTVAEARWLVRLATAAPVIREDGAYYSAADASGGVGDPIGPAWGTLRLYDWALRYLHAETANDVDRMAELDATLAMVYGAGGRHFHEALSTPPRKDVPE